MLRYFYCIRIELQNRVKMRQNAYLAKVGESHNIVSESPFAHLMRAPLRISLWFVLSGLLFSPAEGVCLLPFPPGLVQHRQKANTRTFPYQETVLKIEKHSKERSSPHRCSKFADQGALPGAFFDVTANVATFTEETVRTAASGRYLHEDTQARQTIRPPPAA
jgi:hypothetical protein